MTHSLCASTGTLKHLILSQYLFDSDQGFNFEADSAKDPRLNLVAQDLFEALVAVTYPGRPDLAERIWQVASDATPFAKVQAAFRSVMGKNTPSITSAQRGNLIEYYHAVRKNIEPDLKCLSLWKAVAGDKLDTSEFLITAKGVSDVDHAFRGWLDDNRKYLNVASIDLSQKGLTSLPTQLGYFTKLKSLNLSENNFQTVPKQILDVFLLVSLRVDYFMGQVKLFRSLQQLDLSGNFLRKIPPKIEALNQLRDLFLGGNQLEELPREIGSLTELVNLDLSGNNLEELPPEIGNLTHLEQLDLRGNNLKKLPPEIGNLTNLKVLYLDGNQLEGVPPAIGKLTQLERLDLSDNCLRELPPAVEKLTRLQYFNVGGNELRQLPHEIVHLVNLRTLCLQDNRFKEIPSHIAHLLPHLFKLYLKDNPLETYSGEFFGKLLCNLDLHCDFIADPDVMEQLYAAEIRSYPNIGCPLFYVRDWMGDYHAPAPTVSSTVLERETEGRSSRKIERARMNATPDHDQTPEPVSEKDEIEGSSLSTESIAKADEKAKAETIVASAYPTPSILQAVSEVGTNLVVTQLFTLLSTSFLAYTLASIGEGS